MVDICEPLLAYMVRQVYVVTPYNLTPHLSGIQQVPPT